MAFLRSLLTATTTTAASSSSSLALFSSLSATPPSPSHPSKPASVNFSHFPTTSPAGPGRFLGRVKNLASPYTVAHMEAPTSDYNPSSKSDAVLPDVMTEFMVDMHCDGCVRAVKNKLQTVDGVKNVEVDLNNQVVRVLGSSPVKTMTEALEQSGRKARLIGQGFVPQGLLVSSAVAEFKGPNLFGVVRLTQADFTSATIEANFSGLPPGKHGWSINEFGDLTKGAASTGKVFNPNDQISEKEPVGDLGTLDANEKGEAAFTGIKQNLVVDDLIGRAIAVYENTDRSDKGLSAAVIARSAGVGENYKKLCTCDGTTIWEASDADFVKSKV